MELSKPVQQFNSSSAGRSVLSPRSPSAPEAPALPRIEQELLSTKVFQLERKKVYSLREKSPLTTHEAAYLCFTTPTAVQQWIGRNQIPATFVTSSRRSWLISQKDLRQFMKKNGMPMNHLQGQVLALDLRMLSSPDVARLLNCHNRTVAQMARAGYFPGAWSLPSEKSERRLRIPLRGFVEACKRLSLPLNYFIKESNPASYETEKIHIKASSPLHKVIESSKIALVLGTSEATVAQLFRRGFFPGSLELPLSQERRIPEKVVVQFLKEHGLPTQHIQGSARPIPPALSTTQAADIAGLGRSSIQKYCRDGSLGSYTLPISNTRKIPWASLRSFLRDRDIYLRSLVAYSTADAIKETARERLTAEAVKFLPLNEIDPASNTLCNKVEVLLLLHDPPTQDAFKALPLLWSSQPLIGATPIILSKKKLQIEERKQFLRSGAGFVFQPPFDRDKVSRHVLKVVGLL